MQVKTQILAFTSKTQIDRIHFTSTCKYKYLCFYLHLDKNNLYLQTCEHKYLYFS